MWISVTLVLAKYRLKYIDIGQISVKYRQNARYRQYIGKIKISVSVLVTDKLVKIYLYRYWQKYRLAEYIGIGIGWTHIGLTLLVIQTISLADDLKKEYLGKAGDVSFVQFKNLQN